MNPAKLVRRVGCGALVILWFLFLLTPCFVIVLATQGEIVLTHSDLPGHAFRVWSISERGLRGIAFSTARRVSAENDISCTVADVRFLMWEVSAEFAESVRPSHQCSCYARQGNLWNSVAEGQEACKLAGE